MNIRQFIFTFLIIMPLIPVVIAGFLYKLFISMFVAGMNLATLFSKWVDKGN